MPSVLESWLPIGHTLQLTVHHYASYCKHISHLLISFSNTITGHYTVFTPGFRVVAHSNEPPYAYVPLSTPFTPERSLLSSPGQSIRSLGGTAQNGMHRLLSCLFTFPDCSANCIVDPHGLSAGTTHGASMLMPSSKRAYMHPSSNPSRTTPNTSPSAAPRASLFSTSPVDHTHSHHVPATIIEESPSIDTGGSHGDTTVAESKPSARKKRNGTIRRRAKNAFIFFRSYISAAPRRAELGLPDGAGQQLVSQRAAAIWRGLPNAEKAPFFAQAEADKVRLAAGFDDTLVNVQDDEAAEAGNGEISTGVKRKHRRIREKTTAQQTEARNAGFWSAQHNAPPTPSSTLTLSPLPTVSPAVSDRSLGESSCASGASPLSIPKTPLHPFPLITIPVSHLRYNHHTAHVFLISSSHLLMFTCFFFS